MTTTRTMRVLRLGVVLSVLGSLQAFAPLAPSGKKVVSPGGKVKGKGRKMAEGRTTKTGRAVSDSSREGLKRKTPGKMSFTAVSASSREVVQTKTPGKKSVSSSRKTSLSVRLTAQERRRLKEEWRSDHAWLHDGKDVPLYERAFDEYLQQHTLHLVVDGASASELAIADIILKGRQVDEQEKLLSAKLKRSPTLEELAVFASTSAAMGAVSDEKSKTEGNKGTAVTVQHLKQLRAQVATAKKLLIYGNLKMVTREANQLEKKMHGVVQVRDLIQEGVLGLAGAVDKWNPDTTTTAAAAATGKGEAGQQHAGHHVDFPRHALAFIRGAMTLLLPAKPLSAETMTRMGQVLDCSDALCESLGREPLPKEIAASLRWRKADVDAFLELNRRAKESFPLTAAAGSGSGSRSIESMSSSSSSSGTSSGKSSSSSTTGTGRRSNSIRGTSWVEGSGDRNARGRTLLRLDSVVDETTSLEVQEREIMLRETLSRLLDSLEPRNRQVLLMRYGLQEENGSRSSPGGDGKATGGAVGAPGGHATTTAVLTGLGPGTGAGGKVSLAQVGRAFDISRERVRQIEQQCLQKLRAEHPRPDYLPELLRL